MHKTLKWLKSINLRVRLDPPLSYPSRNYTRFEKHLHNWFFVRCLNMEWMWIRHWWIAQVKYWLGLVPWAYHMSDLVTCEWCHIKFYTFPNSDLRFCSVRCRKGIAITPWWEGKSKKAKD